MDEARAQWHAVAKKETRTLMFRVNGKSDSTKAALVIGSMLYMKDSEPECVPLQFRKAPHLFLSCQELLHPGRILQTFSERMEETARNIVEIMDKARVGPAMLVLTEIDLLSGDERTQPVIQALTSALADEDIRKNLLFLLSATKPGWKLADLNNGEHL